MVSLSSALGIAIGGMQSSQLGLGTVSHNVTNANTVGYTRQSVQTTNVAYNGFGAGVQVGNVDRVVDSFLNTRVLNQLSELESATTTRAYMDTVEGAFTGANTDANLDSLVNNMFAGLNSLAGDPGNSALKRNAVQQLSLVSTTLNGMNSDLTDVINRVNIEISEEISRLNTTLARIGELNIEIATQQAGGNNGANTNDLLDERDRQLDVLAKDFKLNIIVSGSSNSIRVTTENGQKLLDEGSYVQFERTAGTPYQGIGFRNVISDGTLAPYVNTLNTAALTSGKIAALVTLRDTTIPATISQLDEFADTLVTRMNLISSQGVSTPAQRTLTSGNTSGVSASNADLLTELSASLDNTSFNLSVVDSQGDVVSTTVGVGAITLTGAPTLSIDDIVLAINNSSVGVTTLGAGLGVTASATTDSNGDPVLQIQSTNANYKVVMANTAGDFLGLMGMNNILTGSTSGDIAVRSDIVADPSLFPTGRMRADGGLSSLSTANVIELAQLAETTVSFDSAGGLPAQSSSFIKYIGQMTSDLAVTLNSAKTTETYADSLYNQLQQLKGSVGGVNMDEELALMLVYQQSFQASARIITVVDGLMQEVLNMVR
ncbi:MAG: flagellar hook-associated protein FlgK [Alphaproteobacteria bacterium CG_4_10_14_0_8_um_filter_53_9]|nr:MAG: flagellar hook-associated protein FlgK [Alphaproteobacteria bacterium CG_4_10_14_0_8_um_filter_53_9]